MIVRSMAQARRQLLDWQVRLIEGRLSYEQEGNHSDSIGSARGAAEGLAPSVSLPHRLHRRRVDE